jgi:hypothetical protein
MDECSDPRTSWYPQRRICYATMALQSAEAKYDELHKDLPFHDGTFSNWSVDRSRQAPFHYRDGVSLWVADIDLTPDDDFLSLADQSPDDDAEGAESSE